MTTVHVEKFTELVARARAHLARLGHDNINDDADAAPARAAAYITKAVKEAKALGLDINEEEVHAYFWLWTAWDSPALVEMSNIVPLDEHASCFPNYQKVRSIYFNYVLDPALMGDRYRSPKIQVAPKLSSERKVGTPLPRERTKIQNLVARIFKL